jgi:hypothetical protein
VIEPVKEGYAERVFGKCWGSSIYKPLEWHVYGYS